jgi:hypothetical protein
MLQVHAIRHYESSTEEDRTPVSLLTGDSHASMEACSSDLNDDDADEFVPEASPECDSDAT